MFSLDYEMAMIEASAVQGWDHDRAHARESDLSGMVMAREDNVGIGIRKPVDIVGSVGEHQMEGIVLWGGDALISCAPGVVIAGDRHRVTMNIDDHRLVGE